jgi:hypothetical protein
MHAAADNAPRKFDWLVQLRDRPSYWIVLFVNAALVGMWLIAPKYQQREGMLERRYEIRRDSALRQATGQSVEQSGAEADPRAQDRPLMVPLWRLTVLLLVIDAVAVVMFFWRASRTAGSQPTEPSSTRP